MPKYRVEITNVAELDILQIVQYVASDNQMAAMKLVSEIERQIDSLATHAPLGRFIEE